jgi:CBS domain-containing protein
MQVKEVMTQGVECAGPSDTIASAAERMRDLDVGSLPVCGDNDRLVGMITDRDITIRGTAGCCQPEATAVRELMTPNIVYCFEDQDINEAAELMKEKQIRRVVVLNREKRLVGIVSLGDVAVDTHDEQLAGSTLEAISEPAPVA